MLIDLNKIKEYCNQQDVYCRGCKFIKNEFEGNYPLQDPPHRLDVEFIEEIYKKEIDNKGE
jgi:hypothetical protein